MLGGNAAAVEALAASNELSEDEEVVVEAEAEAEAEEVLAGAEDVMTS